MKKIFYILIFVVVGAFSATLYSKNSDLVTLNYYFNISIDLSVFTLICTSFFVGMMMGVLVMTWSVIRNKGRVGQAGRALKKSQKEVENLRAMPLKGEG